MKQVLILGGKEIRDGMRNRWVVLITLLMAGLALVLAFMGSAPTGTTKVSALAVTIVSLSSLSIFFIPLIALLLSYDTIVGESERGTLMLLLSYPVTRWQVVLGKFLGQAVLLSIAIILGFGIAAIGIALNSESELTGQAWSGVLRLLASSALLGAVFIALGLLISAGVRERGTAAGIAVGVWLLFVLVYDMGLLGLLAADTGQTMSDALVNGLLLANPTDVYRMLNLVGNNEVSVLSGMAGLGAAQQVSEPFLVGLLLMWVSMPLIAACLLFQRRAL